jgi:microsomal dipeptidase-like Zn-dependent dipeptidase
VEYYFLLYCIFFLYAYNNAGECVNRRQFLYGLTTFVASLGLGSIPLLAQETKRVPGVLKDMLIVDAHSHPARMLRSEPIKLSARALAIKNMKELGAVTSSFSAVGDVQRGTGFYDRIPARYEQVIEQLNRAKEVIEFTGAKAVRRSSDIPKPSDSGSRIGALLALEGAEPLEGEPKKIDDLYQHGVRIMTLMHYRVSVFGDIMTAPPKHRGLTNEGKKLVGKMQELGIVVDVAHAHIDTLKGIVEMAGKPVIDSHTSLTYTSEPLGARSRSWKEMEMVAKTGGVVCTWPPAFKRKTVQRVTFLDWAREALAMKQRLGIDHIGLGTDNGGLLKTSRVVEGYKDIRDITKLADAMFEVGLTKSDIAAFMGGNLLRIIKACIG